jgi:hypothetical protein
VVAVGFAPITDLNEARRHFADGPCVDIVLTEKLNRMSDLTKVKPIK